MKITLNNNTEELPGNSVTVSEMLELKRFTFRLRIIKINGILVPRDKYESTRISDGDDVQMLYLMSGG